MLSQHCMASSDVGAAKQSNAYSVRATPNKAMQTTLANRIIPITCFYGACCQGSRRCAGGRRHVGSALHQQYVYFMFGSGNTTILASGSPGFVKKGTTAANPKSFFVIYGA